MPKKERPTKILTLDTETYNGLLGGLKKVAIYDGQTVIYGNTYQEILPNIIKWNKDGYNVHVYIHNLEFDSRKLDGLFNNDIKWEKSFVINNKLAKIQTTYYAIHDSFKLLPMSLKELSGEKGFNVEHGKMDLWETVQKLYPNQYNNVVDFLDRCEIDNPTFIEYLGLDVISLYEVIEALINESGICVEEFVKCLSTASLSRHIFKHGYKGHVFRSDNVMTDYDYMTCFNWKNDIDLENFIRSSYCGGRVEVFRTLLQEQGYHYDYNSLYPDRMRGKFPIGKPIYSNNPQIVENLWKQWIDTKQGLCIISCDVYIPFQYVPPLPVKMGKLTFPCGHVYGTWTCEELEYSILNCGVKIERFNEIAYFNKTHPVFDDFIKVMFEVKQRGKEQENPALTTFGKLIMNTGYGYTGMTRDDKNALRSIEEIDKHDEINYINQDLGYIEIPAIINAEYIQVQIASFVTSRARIKLLDALRKASENGNIYYCDTDSIVTNKPFDSSLIHKWKLGFLDLEGEPTKAVFLFPKVYAESFTKSDGKEISKNKFKGVSRETQKTLDYDYYMNLLNEILNGTPELTVEKNKLMLHSVMYLHKNNLPMNDYEYRDKTMNLQANQKRIVHYEQNNTEPYYFETLEDFQNFSYARVETVAVI